MGIFDRFRRQHPTDGYARGRQPLVGAKTLPENLRGSAGWDTLWGVPGIWKSATDIWKPMTKAEMEQAFARHPIVRACVKILAETAARARLEIGRWEGDTWKPVAKHWALSLLQHPNSYYSENDFIQYVVARYVLTGYGYWMKWRNQGASGIGEVWPIPSSWVEPKRNDRGGNTMWAGYKVTGQDGLIPEEDMGVLKQIDPGTTSEATSGLQAALHDYQLDLSRQGYQAEMLENLRIPGVVIRNERGFTPQQKSDIEERFEERFGKGKRGRPMFVEGNGTVELINPLADLDWPGLTGLGETRLCAAFGVPPIVVHVRAGLDRATYSNYEQAFRAMCVNTMTAHWDALDDSLTRAFLYTEDGEEELCFRSRYDELAEFQEDKDKVNARIIARFQAGVISRDEAREELGYDPDPEFEDQQRQLQDRLAMMEARLSAAGNEDEQKDSDPKQKDKQTNGDK